MHEVPQEFDSSFSIGETISEGYELFKQNAGLFIGYSALLFFGESVLLAIPVVGIIGLVAILTPLIAGFYIVARKTEAGHAVDFGDFFKGFDKFLPLFLVGLISSILIGIGLLFLLIPGIYLAVGYTFIIPIALFMLDDFWQAMELSRKVVARNWWQIFGFVIVLGLINLGGTLACGIGYIFTYPITACATYVAYRKIFEPGKPAGTWSDPNVMDSEFTQF